MKLIALLLFIMIVLTVINGLVFMKKLIKLQQENNNLLKEIVSNKNSVTKNDDAPMPHTELERYKTQFMQNPYQPPK
jgi:CDP-diacylglycerol pyrophosphatase